MRVHRQSRQRQDQRMAVLYRQGPLEEVEETLFCSSSGTSVLVGQGTVRPRLSGPLLSGSLAIRKKIAGYRVTAHVMHTYSMCVRLSDSLAYPDIFVENGHVQLSEV